MSYMIRKRPKNVPYKERSGFFLPDYGYSEGVCDDTGCLFEEEFGDE
jgi:hypothetical protein